MNYLKYNIESGTILAKISVDENLIDAYRDEETDIIVGDGDPDTQFVRSGKLVAKTDRDIKAISLIETDVATKVLSNLPKPCWIKIRGSGNIQFSEQVIHLPYGYFEFTPEISGTYYVSLQGAHNGSASFEAISLDEYKARRNTEVNATKDTAILSGMIHDGHRWDVGEKSQLAINSILASVNSGMTLPTGYYWTDFNNVDVPVTADGLTALGNAMLTFTFSIHSNARTLKGKIEAASSLTEVSKIDITQGW